MIRRPYLLNIKIVYSYVCIFDFLTSTIPALGNICYAENARNISNFLSDLKIVFSDTYAQACNKAIVSNISDCRALMIFLTPSKSSYQPKNAREWT